MCIDLISLAQCAANSATDKSVFCGHFHLVAGEQIVCDEARGKCICSFGTCGKVITKSPPRIANSDILMLPCTVCTARMGDLPENRKFLKPFLLKGPHSHEEYLELKLNVPQTAGHEDFTCSYHAESSATKGRAAANEHAKEHVLLQADNKPIVSPALVDASSDEVGPNLEGPECVVTDASEHHGEDAASPANPWTGAPIVTEPAIHEHVMTESTIAEPLEKDDESAVVANNNEGETSIKAGSDSGNDDQKGLEGDTTPISRRAVSFQYSAEAADKLRDTTEKFASLKSGFLMGKTS